MAFSLNPESHEEGEKHVVSMPISSIVSSVSIQTPYNGIVNLSQELLYDDSSTRTDEIPFVTSLMMLTTGSQPMQVFIPHFFMLSAWASSNTIICVYKQYRGDSCILPSFHAGMGWSWNQPDAAFAGQPFLCPWVKAPILSPLN